MRSSEDGIVMKLPTPTHERLRLTRRAGSAPKRAFLKFYVSEHLSIERPNSKQFLTHA